MGVACDKREMHTGLRQEELKYAGDFEDVSVYLITVLLRVLEVVAWIFLAQVRDR